MVASQFLVGKQIQLVNFALQTLEIKDDGNHFGVTNFTQRNFKHEVAGLSH